MVTHFILAQTYSERLCNPSISGFDLLGKGFFLPDVYNSLF
jgi:hypothetical protein